MMADDIEITWKRHALHGDERAEFDSILAILSEDDEAGFSRWVVLAGHPGLGLVQSGGQSHRESARAEAERAIREVHADPRRHLRVLTLTLDEPDYATIQAEIARRQLVRWPDGNASPGLIDPNGPAKSGTIMPDGDSCLAGTLIAEMVRDLDEYRGLPDRENPK